MADENNLPKKERPSIRLAELALKESRKDNASGEIDNLYDELFKTPGNGAEKYSGGSTPVKNDLPREEGPSIPTAQLSSQETEQDNSIGDIDYLYDELFKKSDKEAEDYSGGEWPIQSLILEYLDGTKKSVAKAVLFRPVSDALTIEADEETKETVVPLADLSCIRMAVKPPGLPRDGGRINSETVEIGEQFRYKVSVPEKQYSEFCLYGHATDKKTYNDEYFFFPYCNIRQRCQTRSLGEIITHLGMLTADEVKKAVEEQRERRRRRLGEIIAHLARISPQVVERTIQKAYRKNVRLNVGEILVKAGLINEDVVDRALKVQEKMRKKLGEMLFDRGILSEEQVYRALAEKFSMPYVDLLQEKFTRKAVAAISNEMAIKLSVVPISFDKTALVVATIFPDKPATKEILRQHTNQKDIKMVLTRPSQLRAAIKKFYQ